MACGETSHSMALVVAPFGTSERTTNQPFVCLARPSISCNWSPFRFSMTIVCRSASGTTVSLLPRAIGAIGLPRENAELPVHVIGFAEEDAGKELEIESDFADPRFRQRLVEVDDDLKGRACGFDPDRVAEIKVRIDDGIEPFAVFLRVR